MTLQLARMEPFARGGNRLCYVHPENPARCIKVRRPDFTLEDRRRKKGFPKNLRPLSAFDDNLEEQEVMKALETHYGDRVFRHVSRCYGFVETDMGKGLMSELIRDGDGRISQTLKKYLWDFGLTPEITLKIKELTDFWASERVPSRDLLLHNIVVQKNDREQLVRLVVIDGLGSAGVVPLRLLPGFLQDRKVAAKISNMDQRIRQLLGQRGEDTFPGYHGLLIHDGLSESIQESRSPQGKGQ